MWYFKQLSRLASITLFIVLFFKTSAASTILGPCNVRFRCSMLESVVWATDNRNCFVFRNACLWESENCSRRNRNLKVLQRVSRAKCQTMCRNVCTMDFRPVCADNKGVRRTFGNSCALANHICQTGQTFTQVTPGECR